MRMARRAKGLIPLKHRTNEEILKEAKVAPMAMEVAMVRAREKTRRLNGKRQM